MDSDYILVDNNLDSIEIDNNNNDNKLTSHYLTEYDYYDTISNSAEYIIKEIMPVIYDITLTISEIWKAALISNNEYYTFHPFNY